MVKYLTVFLLILTGIIAGCGNQKANIQAGTICTIEDGDGKYGVIKVLVIDDEIAHIKVYKNKYTQRPAKVDMKTLSLGSLNDADGFGIGHMPIARKGFDAWKPIPVGFETVTKDDLEGYEIWKAQ